MKHTSSLKISSIDSFVPGKASGFTLVEILFVVVVMGIMMLVAVPSFLSWRPNLHFRQGTRDLFMDIQAAKMEAIKRNTNVGASFVTVACPAPGLDVPSPGGSYTIFYDDGSGGGTVGDGIQNGTEQTFKTIELPRYVALCNTSAPASISIEPNGMPSGAVALNLDVQNDKGRQGQVTMSIAGNVELN